MQRDELVSIIADEVRRVLATAGGDADRLRGAAPGRGVPACGEGVARAAKATPSPPSPARPCKATKGECVGCGWSVSRRPAETRRILELGATRISARPQVGGHVAADIAPFIDHTLLKAEATREDLDKLCAEAAEHGFASVCVNPSHVRHCRRRLRGSDVMVVTVVGFPLGATSADAKVFETRQAIDDGAAEIDMVINIGLLKSRDHAAVYDDIRRVVQAAHPRPVKVIIEAASLDDHEKVMACTLSKAAGASFVKTSTGFGAGGATAGDVALMKAVVGADVEVKASGGIRTIDDVRGMIAAGATRIGASASVAIVTGKAPAKASGARRAGGY